MLRILGKPTLAKVNGSPFPAVHSDDHDLSAWELIDAAQSDDEDLYSFDLLPDGDAEICVKFEPIQQANEEDSSDMPPPTQFIDPVAAPASPPLTIENRYEDEETAHADSFAEELMPWDLERKLGGLERMKKRGKKGGHKYIKTKRLPCYYKVKPGSLY